MVPIRSFVSVSIFSVLSNIWLQDLVSQVYGMNHKRSVLQTRGRNNLLESLKLGKMSQKNGERAKYNNLKSCQARSFQRGDRISSSERERSTSLAFPTDTLLCAPSCHYYCLTPRTRYLCIGMFPSDCELLGDSNPN